MDVVGRSSVLWMWLEEKGRSQYARAGSISAPGNDLDSEEEPYKSKYASRKIIKQLICDVEDIIVENESGSAESSVTNACLGVLTYDLALNEIETEEVASGEDHLETALELCDKVDSSELHTSLRIAIHNQLGLIWSTRAEHSRALQCFNEAKSAYDLRKEKSPLPPVAWAELFSNEPNNSSRDKQREEEFEKLHTLTLYYLAQAHANLGQADISARYCKETLGRQLAVKQFNPVDWSLNCATLSQFYITKHEYPLAKHCLACSSTVIRQAEDALQVLLDNESAEEEEKESQEEKVKKAKADICRCWVKYCIDLLNSSHERQLRACVDGVPLEDAPPGADALQGTLFSDLDISDTEPQVTTSFVCCFDDAKQLFQHGQSYLAAAKQFYVLDGYVTDYVEVQQDLSQLYKLLAFFENDFERRCKMHKRRIDLLNAILVELNPQHFLQISRQLMFEIAEVYSSMAELKKAIIEDSSSKRTAQAVLKVNFLILQSLKFYTAFRDSYQHKGELPETFEEDAIRGVLLTFFYSARLYSKYLTVDQSTKLKYLQNEYECYEFIVRYCKNHVAAAGQFVEELQISTEMMELFPIKKAQLLGTV